MGCSGFCWLWMDFCTGAWRCWWDSILSPHSGKICVNPKRRVWTSKRQDLPSELEGSSRGEQAAGWSTLYVVNSHVYYDNLDSTHNTLQWHGPLPLSLPLCSPSSFIQCVADGNPSDLHIGSREYQNSSAEGFQIAMGLDSIWESRKTLWKPGLRSEPFLLWLTPGRRARCSSCSWWMTAWFCKQM